jgi:hypothetical protein
MKGELFYIFGPNPGSFPFEMTQFLLNMNEGCFGGGTKNIIAQQCELGIQ